MFSVNFDEDVALCMVVLVCNMLVCECAYSWGGVGQPGGADTNSCRSGAHSCKSAGPNSVCCVLLNAFELVKREETNWVKAWE